MREVEIRYPKIEMLTFALVVAAHQSIPYFQAHPIKSFNISTVKKDIAMAKHVELPSELVG